MRDELRDYMTERYNDPRESTVKKLIDYSRLKEKEYKEGKIDNGGVWFLTTMVTEGSLTMSNFLSIYPAVSNYNQPYELNINN